MKQGSQGRGEGEGVEGEEKGGGGGWEGRERRGKWGGEGNGEGRGMGRGEEGEGEVEGKGRGIWRGDLEAVEGGEGEGRKFKEQGSFLKGLTACGFYMVRTPNMLCYSCCSSKVCVLGAHIET